MAAIGRAVGQEQASVNQEEAAASDPVSFEIDIQPIFAARCYKCHGPQKRSGGLRLDSEEFAASGGDSGKPILHGTLETNELYQRVSSSERTYRMPKNADPLPEAEIEFIKRWVQQGTPWTKAAAVGQPHKPPFYERWLLSSKQFEDRYKFEAEFIKPYAIGFLALQLILLLISRAKLAYTRYRPWAHGKARWFCRHASSVTGREMGLAWLLALGALSWVGLWAHQKKIATELAGIRKAQAHIMSPWTQTIYGYPPVPVRPNQPKQLSGTYYRGNCERNSSLFNGGNYLTATFRLQLCDANHQPMEVGGHVEDGRLCVRLEIERAPRTADVLYSKELMGSVFFSETFYDNNAGPVKDEPVRLETLDEGKRWVAYYPIGPPRGMNKLSGLIYLYTGRIENQMARGDPHYAIKYDLQLADGKLAADSDLWMNSFGNPAVAPPDVPGKIPYREWFDFRPIPEITGENSTDPKLLGVDEYVRKGLISAPNATGAQQTTQAQASSDASDADEEGPQGGE